MQHHGQPEAVTRAIGEFVCPSRRAAWVRGAADLKELRVSISPAFRTHRRLACGHTIDCASPWSIDMDTLRIVRWLALSLSLVAVNPVNAANHTIFFTDYCQSAPLCFQPDRMTIAIGDSVTFRFACEIWSEIRSGPWHCGPTARGSNWRAAWLRTFPTASAAIRIDCGRFW